VFVLLLFAGGCDCGAGGVADLLAVRVAACGGNVAAEESAGDEEAFQDVGLSVAAVVGVGGVWVSGGVAGELWAGGFAGGGCGSGGVCGVLGAEKAGFWVLGFGLWEGDWHNFVGTLWV